MQDSLADNQKSTHEEHSAFIRPDTRVHIMELDEWLCSMTTLGWAAHITLDR